MARRAEGTVAKRRPAAKPRTKKKVGTPGEGKPGEEPFAPTDDQRLLVSMLVAAGHKQEHIASLVTNPNTKKGIALATLHKYFRQEIDDGGARANAMVAGELFRKATSKDHAQAATCAIWWTKARMRWRGESKLAVDVTAKSGVLVVPATLSPEQWIEAQRATDDERGPPEEE